ncbi:MAG: FHA domain-containing protein [Pseudomonadota bacterium]
MVKLVIEDDEGKTTVVPLIRDEISIGRKEGNTIRLTERNVSRRHARLLKQNSSVFVEDLDSYNGIKVNGTKISGKVQVSEGDRIQIGDYVIALKSDHASLEATAELPAIEPSPASQITPIQDMATQRIAPTEQKPEQQPEQLASLVCVSSNFAGLKFVLNKGEMTIGRTDENDITINHRSVSAQHARIKSENGQFNIEDLNSRNGVRVNSEEFGKVELQKGDLVDLGHVRLRFVAPDEDFDFSRDAIIVDLAKEGPSRRGLFMALGAVLVLGIGIVLWKVIDTRTSGSISSTAGEEQTAQRATPTDPKVLLARIDQAIAKRQWQIALQDCKELGKSMNDQAQERCLVATNEGNAQQLFKKACDAEMQNQHEQALGLFALIPRESVYFSSLENSPHFEQAKVHYLSQMHSRVDRLVADGECNQAQVLAAAIKKLVPDDLEGVQKAAGCKPTVVADSRSIQRTTHKQPSAKNSATTKDQVATKDQAPTKDQAATKGQAPQDVTPPKAKKPAIQEEPTLEQKQQAKDFVAQARKAYMVGQYEQAISFAKNALELLPRASEAYTIMGASSCYLKNASNARKAYRRLKSNDRQLLKQLCFRFGITLP